MPKIKVDDINIYYEIHGQGDPLVMIMGLGGNVTFWDPRLVSELSKKFRLILFDNRGAGRTDISDEKYTIKLFADDTAGLMDALGIPKAHVLGISMGGMIAQELALNHPEKVKKLVLCATFCGGAKTVQASPEVLKRFTANRSKLSPRELAQNMISLVFTEDFVKNNPEIVELTIQQTLKFPISNEAFMRQLKAVEKFDTYDRLSQIKAPTLILHGKRDILVPPENGSILAKRIPNAKLVYLENSAHGLAEDMDKVIRALIEFLSNS